MESANPPANLQARFTTKQSHYAVPNTIFSIPTNVSNQHLNSLINELLRESNTSGDTWVEVEFDFLVNGEFVRIPLTEHLAKHSLSFEETIPIEYVERHPAPEPQDCLKHDDWVSAVEVRDDWILSGCYDNTLHLWTTRGEHHLTIPGHNGPIKAVAWVSCDNKMATFVSASHDQTAMLWRWNVQNNSVDCIHLCKGHERGLDCVSVNSTGMLMATGGWDTLLKIWSTDIDEKPVGESAPKKRKSDKTHVRTPVMTLKGHKEAITSAAWTDMATVCTASWDHTLRMWDAEMGGITNEIVGNKAFFDVAYSPLNGTLLTASADRHIRMYDPRSNEGSVVKTTFSSHTQWVSSVRWSKTDSQIFISGGYDNLVKLWDARSPKAPLFDLSGHEDKVLCCDWSNPKLMVSGGSDNTIRIFKSKLYS